MSAFSWGTKKDKKKIKEKFFNDAGLSKAEIEYKKAKAEQAAANAKKPKLKEGGVVKSPCIFSKITKMIKKKK